MMLLTVLSTPGNQSKLVTPQLFAIGSKTLTFFFQGLQLQFSLARSLSVYCFTAAAEMVTRLPSRIASVA